MESSYFYLGGDELHSGMYIALIKQLEREGLIVNLVTRIRVSLNPLATWAAWKNRHSVGPNPIPTIREQIRGTVSTIPVWAPLPGLSVPSFSAMLRERAPQAERIVLHTRQIVMGRLALALKRRWPGVRVIPELEADTLAELDYVHTFVPRPSPMTRLRWSVERWFYSRQEYRLVHHSDAVICVSQKLKDVLVQRYRLTPDMAGRMFVFPSVGSPADFHFDPLKRQEIRQALGLDGRFVVVYSGNLNSRWQVPDKLVDVFGLIREHRPNAFFLIITPERDRPHIVPHLRRAGVSPAEQMMLSCRHREIGGYLCVGDVGLLLRERHPANEAGAPGKFSEYVLSGLPVVMTEGIGDFSGQMRDSEFACLLPELDHLEAMRERIHRFCGRDFTAEQRTTLSRWAAERFSTELRVAQLAALYRSV